MNQGFVADIESANGTEPFNSAPMDFNKLVQELQEYFDILPPTYNMEPNQSLYCTFTTINEAAIHVYEVKETDQA